MTHLVNIAIYPDGYFLAEAMTIGTSPEEIELISLGQVAEERIMPIRFSPMTTISCSQGF